MSITPAYFNLTIFSFNRISEEISTFKRDIYDITLTKMNRLVAAIAIKHIDNKAFSLPAISGISPMNQAIQELESLTRYKKKVLLEPKDPLINISCQLKLYSMTAKKVSGVMISTDPAYYPLWESNSFVKPIIEDIPYQQELLDERPCFLVECVNVDYYACLAYEIINHIPSLENRISRVASEKLFIKFYANERLNIRLEASEKLAKFYQWLRSGNGKKALMVEKDAARLVLSKNIEIADLTLPL